MHPHTSLRRFALSLMAVLATGCTSPPQTSTSFADLMGVSETDRALLRHSSGKGIHDASVSATLNGFVIYSEVGDYPDQKSLYITKDGVLLAVVNDNEVQQYNRRTAAIRELAKVDVRDNRVRYSSPTHTFEDHGLDGVDVVYSHRFQSTGVYGASDGREVRYGGAFADCRPLSPELPEVACCMRNGKPSAWRLGETGWMDISLRRSPATGQTVVEQCRTSTRPTGGQ